MYQEEGDAGRKKFAQYSRLLTVLGFGAGLPLLPCFKIKEFWPNSALFDLVTNLIVISAGSLLLMWLGELITEFGVAMVFLSYHFCRYRFCFAGQCGSTLFTFDPSQLPALHRFHSFFAVVVISGVWLLLLQ